MNVARVCSSGFEHMTKELTASAPSATKIKVVAPTDGNIFNVGAERFRCAEVLFLPKTREIPDGNFFTVCVKSFRCAEGFSSSSLR